MLILKLLREAVGVVTRGIGLLILLSLELLLLGVLLLLGIGIRVLLLSITSLLWEIPLLLLVAVCLLIGSTGVGGVVATVFAWSAHS